MVERGGLENRCGRKSTQGSNPCLSAIRPQALIFFIFLPLDLTMEPNLEPKSGSASGSFTIQNQA